MKNIKKHTLKDFQMFGITEILLKITKNGGVVVYGRSDATLNPGGVRIGTAEIYRIVESVDEVVDSIVVGQNWNNDVRVILFVVLKKWI
jgi:acetoacetyl-CoA synthetase